MIKLYSDRRICQFFEIAILLFVFIQILYFLGFIYWLFYTATLASILAVMFCKDHCERFAVQECRRHKELQEKRLLLIRRLIDHSYTYKYDKVLFYKKFCDEINIEKFRKCNLINQGEIIEDVDLSDKSLSIKKLDKLSNEDYEFISLINEGFTPRELSVIFNLSHPQSIYVKRHRVRSRLEGRKRISETGTSVVEMSNVGLSNAVMDLSNVVS